MRIAILLLAGCIQPPPPDDPSFPPPPPPDDGWTDTSGNPIGGCSFDCGSDVCARDGQCYPANLVRAVHTRWTIDGAPASVDACASHPDLHITFTDSTGGTRIGFAPVPCRAGLFTVDKLPEVYSRVELGIEGQDPSDSMTFDESGNAMLDLP